MASNGVPNVPAVRNCYNCGQPGHISRFCPLPDRRLNGVQPSNAILPAQPLLTLPSTSNVGTAVPYYSGPYNGGSSGSGLGRKVSTLEEIVGRINSKHEANEARLREQREEEERKKREKEEEERRLAEKKEREEFQSEMHREMSTKLDKVCDDVNGKKIGESNEITKLRALVESLSRQCNGGRTTEGEEVVKLRAHVEHLKRVNDGASTSATLTRAASEADKLVRLRREQVEGTGG
ncbi:hypothetical protein CBR_g4487 [Chara braunii]|uniref:CCHC-type domain-containing protein n=1 Tax=Chara braunii TaxID=69332 RepID=A0A388KI18_CHABU|nr:hypothetical protein CBR_g4487 [Chara braunii]|eukprot:GBG69657.1 hypothetical protein CBR_g4487 [Chara braunii]